MVAPIQPLMTIVMDSNVLLSAAGSKNGSAWQCFILFAERRFRLAVTGEVLLEYETTAKRLAGREGRFKGMIWRPLFDYIRLKSDYFEPAPLGKKRSRDAEDDIFLACALAAGAKFLISYDADLLDLEKPFGIQTLTPAAFLKLVQKPH